MYEQLKSRPRLTLLEERLVLLVHTQKKRIRFRELELQALAGATEANEKMLDETIQQLKKMMFPGPDPIDTEMEARKAALAREAEKAFVVRKIDPKEFIKKGLPTNPEAARMAGKVMAEVEREHLKNLDRQRKAQAQKQRQEAARALKKQMQSRRK